MADPYFHPTRFKEFQPELEAGKALEQAQKALEGCTTESGARMRLHVMAAAASLPDVLKLPEARAELEQRIAGKFQDPADRPAPPTPAELELQRLRDQNTQLEQRLRAMEEAATRPPPA